MFCESHSRCPLTISARNQHHIQHQNAKVKAKGTGVDQAHHRDESEHGSKRTERALRPDCWTREMHRDQAAPTPESLATPVNDDARLRAQCFICLDGSMTT